MNKVFCIPDNLVFSPCKVDAAFWQNFHVIISLLGDPEELLRLKSEEPDNYAAAIEPLIRFVSETELELSTKNLLKEVDIS